ncbi:hypothetical protein A2U01_0077287, partial [Trifolium medium]|nr:hypothetical protein [Trifolium medium]
MADNTRMKEVYAELKKNADEIARVSESLSGQLDRMEAANTAQRERMEAIQMANDSQFSQLNATMVQ